ncbi:hypothetical protein P171DRAFT_122473 [Karstenula rhodostoma CBS 690.94]|uniref:Uncharacterized protein n=1 Tax=Karstenula rhodostoma CBS 690.94 TaxID=1392251 RepID=A0A9P4PA36_9PLEO|nr:hypothetical protein P171DRAFT_122473 [Karstenula rhodostoma CBS 690.94]
MAPYLSGPAVELLNMVIRPVTRCFLGLCLSEPCVLYLLPRLSPWQARIGRGLASIPDGRPTPTTFNPLEWDYYGKIGTWSRWFNLLWSKTGDLFMDNLIFLPVLVVVVPALVLLRWLARRQQQQEVALPAEDDAEAALLDAMDDDAVPEHEDVDENEKV